MWLSSITYSNSWNIMVFPIIKIDKKMIIIPTTPLNSPVGLFPKISNLYFYGRTYVASTLEELMEVKSLGTSSLGHASPTPPMWSRDNWALVVEVFYEWILQLKVCGISSRFDSPLQSEGCLIIYRRSAFFYSDLVLPFTGTRCIAWSGVWLSSKWRYGFWHYLQNVFRFVPFILD